MYISGWGSKIVKICQRLKRTVPFLSVNGQSCLLFWLEFGIPTESLKEFCCCLVHWQGSNQERLEIKNEINLSKFLSEFWKNSDGTNQMALEFFKVQYFFYLDTQWLQKVWTFEFLPSVFEKVILTGLSSLQKKRCLNSIWYFMILPKKTYFSKHKNKAEFKCLDDSESSVVIFQALKPL